MSGLSHGDPAPNGRCGATTRSGASCRHEAGWGTDHVGTGRCKLHGGSVPVGRASGQFKHGRYSRVHREELRDLIEEYAHDPDPLDLEQELAALRALFADYLSKPDVSHTDAAGIVEAISRVVKRIEDVRSQNALSRPELARIYSEMWLAVRQYATPEAVEKIGDAWLAIRL